jgi:hypothetical protein
MRLTGLAAAGIVLALAACAPTSAPPGEIIHDAGGDASQCQPVRSVHLVGRPRSEIPPTPAGATWRVTCTTCPVTMDYNPGRLNILYDRDTGVVREVKCG